MILRVGGAQSGQDVAATFAKAMRAVLPMELHTLIRGFFYFGALPADIGCSSSRDAVWLSCEGYPTLGYDASPARPCHRTAGIAGA